MTNKEKIKDLELRSRLQFRKAHTKANFRPVKNAVKEWLKSERPNCELDSILMTFEKKELVWFVDQLLCDIVPESYFLKQRVSYSEIIDT